MVNHATSVAGYKAHSFRRISREKKLRVTLALSLVLSVSREMQMRRGRITPTPTQDGVVVHTPTQTNSILPHTNAAVACHLTLLCCVCMRVGPVPAESCTPCAVVVFFVSPFFFFKERKDKKKMKMTSV
jgi:hypothetical protein